MLTLAEFGDAEANGATAIVAKVVGEIVVEVISPREFAIDDEFQVVADTTARGIDTTLVVEFGHEVRRAVHLVAVGEGLGIQIAVDVRTNGVCMHATASREHKTAVLTVGRQRLVIVQGIQRHESIAIRIADILGNGKGDVEPASDNTIGPTIERLRTVFVDKRLIGPVRTRIVQLTGDGFLGIPHCGCDNTVESGCLRLPMGDMAADASHRTRTQLYVTTDRLAIDAVDHHLGLRTGQPQGRITQQAVLQLVGRDIRSLADKVALGSTHSLANGVAWREHIIGKGQIHHLIIGSIDGSRGSEEGHTPTPLTEHHGLTDILLLPVERHDIARSSHP